MRIIASLITNGGIKIFFIEGTCNAFHITKIYVSPVVGRHTYAISDTGRIADVNPFTPE